MRFSQQLPTLLSGARLMGLGGGAGPPNTAAQGCDHAHFTGNEPEVQRINSGAKGPHSDQKSAKPEHNLSSSPWSNSSEGTCADGSNYFGFALVLGLFWCKKETLALVSRVWDPGIESQYFP